MSQGESDLGTMTPRAIDLAKLQGLTARIKRGLDGLCGVVEDIEKLREKEAQLLRQLQSDLTRLSTLHPAATVMAESQGESGASQWRKDYLTILHPPVIHYPDSLMPSVSTTAPGISSV